MLTKIIDPGSGVAVRLARSAADLEHCLFEISQTEEPQSFILDMGDMQGRLKVEPVAIPDISKTIMEMVREQEESTEAFIHVKADDEVVPLADITAFKELVLRLEADEDLLICSVDVDGGAGSTLLNFALPDFTPEEEKKLVRIFLSASDRTVKEYQNSINLCNRRIAALQGITVLKGGDCRDERP